MKKINQEHSQMLKNDDPTLIIVSLFLWTGCYNLIKWIFKIIVMANAHNLGVAMSFNVKINLAGFVIFFLVILRKVYLRKDKFKSFHKLAISLIILISWILPILLYIAHLFQYTFSKNFDISTANTSVMTFNIISGFAGTLLFCLFLMALTTKGKIIGIAKNIISFTILLVYSILASGPDIEIPFINEPQTSITFEGIFYNIIISVGFLCLGILYKRTMVRLADSL